MESNIKLFENPTFGKIRSVMDESNEPWFCAMDVCKALELSNTKSAVSRLDEDELTKFNLGSRQGSTIFVNEFGLYSLVLSSRKPEAKDFKRWITHEVLPSIRKSGGYVVPGVDDKVSATLLQDICYIKQRFQEWEEGNKRISEKKEALGTMPIRGFYSDTTVLAYAQMRRYEMSYQEFYKVCTKARDIAVRNDVKLKTVPDYGVGDMYIYPCWLLDEVFGF